MKNFKIHNHFCNQPCEYLLHKLSYFCINKFSPASQLCIPSGTVVSIVRSWVYYSGPGGLCPPSSTTMFKSLEIVWPCINRSLSQLAPKNETREIGRMVAMEDEVSVLVLIILSHSRDET